MMLQFVYICFYLSLSWVVVLSAYM